MVVIIESYVQLELKGRFSDLHTERFRSWGTMRRLFPHFQPLYSPLNLHAGLLCSEGCLDLGRTDRRTDRQTYGQNNYPTTFAHGVTNKQSTVTLVAHARRGLMMTMIYTREHPHTLVYSTTTVHEPRTPLTCTVTYEELRTRLA